MPVPRYREMFNAVLQAIRHLGGSATIPELTDEVSKIMSLTDEQIAERHNERMTELEYQLTWTRSYLRTYGLLDTSQRGVWTMTEKGKTVQTVDPAEVDRFVRNQGRSRRQRRNTNGQPPDVADPEAVLEQTWRDELQATLLDLPPDTFERLCQRLLRESGFVEVRVTGQSGDGGIDGVGIVRLGGLLGFPILFQCKRYRDSVSAGTIRDFRGAMIGRADRGLVITTGTFSREAKAEAIRDGAPPIDLVDGEQLLDKLKELRLGIEVEMVEKVSVLPGWFQRI